MADELILDDLDRKLEAAYPGRVVRKDLVKKLKVGFNIPVYVLEYLLGKYCSTTNEAEIAEGLESVKTAIAERIVKGDQSELIKARLQRTGSLKLIDLVTATFDEKVQGGKFWAKLATCGLDKVHIDHDIVHKHERLLTGGVWSNVELVYDDTLSSDGVDPTLCDPAAGPDPGREADFEEFVQGRSQLHPRRMDRRAPALDGLRADAPRLHSAPQAALPAPPGPDGRAKLQPDRAWAAGNGQVVCLSRDLALRHPALGWPGWRTRPLRLEEPEGQAGTGPEVRPGRLRRSGRQQLQGRERQADVQGLHGTGLVFAG